MVKPHGLFGPHPLTAIGVASAVRGKLPGVYALGKLGDDGIFYIGYVGRSDDDLAARLQQHVLQPHPQFVYGFFETAEAAFKKECRLYHDFTPPRNKAHPARPKGTNYPCPVPDCNELP